MSHRRPSFGRAQKERLPEIKQEWLSPEQEAFLQKTKRRNSGYKKSPSTPPDSPINQVLGWFGGSPTAKTAAANNAAKDMLFF